MHRLILFFAALLLAGCSQPAKTFYMLTASGPMPGGGGVGVGLGPVNIAEYLDRPNLVIQESSNELAVAEDHRWAGDLADSIARVTAANLGRELHTGNVRVYPWHGDDQLRYQVTLDIRQLHSEDSGYAVIEASWRAYSLPDRRLIMTRTFTDREALEKDGYNASVAAQSRLLQRLAANIAAGLR